MIVWCGAAFGYAFVLGFSEITLRFRDAIRDRGVVGSWTAKLMECPACIGFWIGVSGAAFGVTGNHYNPILFGFFTCGTNLILGRITGLIDEG